MWSKDKKLRGTMIITGYRGGYHFSEAEFRDKAGNSFKIWGFGDCYHDNKEIYPKNWQDKAGSITAYIEDVLKH